MSTFQTFQKVSVGIGCAYILYRASATLLRRYLVTKLTALDELSKIGTKSTRWKSGELRGTVVICGGSIAGLLTAKVCSDHFEKVVIVESEEWITTPEGYTGSHRAGPASRKRSHITQYNAVHFYQPFLVEALIKWFPNLKEECEKLGGRIVSNYWSLVFSGIPFAKPFSPGNKDPITLRLSRPGLETLVRRLVITSCKNVQYLPGSALGLEYDTADPSLITGVRVRASNKEENTLSAALVIDCTGSSAAGLRWLKDLATSTGNEAAVHQLNNLRKTYDPKQSYHTCEFDVPPEVVPRLMESGFPADWDAVGAVWSIFPDSRLGNRFFGITRKDHNYMEIFCGGWSVTEEITNIEDIRSFISNLRLYQPLPNWIFRVLDVLEEYNIPLTIHRTRMGPAVYIPYNEYGHMPSNFVAIGDSVLKANPATGTGCAKACIGALTLNKLLEKSYPSERNRIDRLPKDFSKKFHKLQAERIGSLINDKINDYAWESTVPHQGEDLKTFKRFQQAFGRLVLRTSMQDGEVVSITWNIQAFLAPPTDLFAPRILFKILKVYLFDNTPLLP